MKKKLIILITFCFSTQIPAQESWKVEAMRPYIQKGYEITEIEKDLLEVKNKTTGLITKYVDVSDRGIAPLSSSPTMQVFDLINADTNLMNYKYTYKNKILVSGLVGYPMVINDINNNGNLDFIGSYKISPNMQLAKCAVIEMNPDSSFSLQKLYQDSLVNTIASSDIDRDGITEINFKFAGGQLLHNYESTTNYTYPDTLNFVYQMWQISGAVGSETFDDLDNDGIQDLVYKGDDSLAPSGTKIFVAEYDSNINNFVKRYSYRPLHWRVSGFSIGDFDMDGFKEFVTGSAWGDVYVFENTGNDSYEFTFSDTVSTSNAYLTCATNDIDHNGKIEFFLGGSSFYNGVGATKIYWFEANGNNSYTKKNTFFLLGTDVLGTTEMYSYDVNADNVDDLVFAFSSSVVILTWNQSGFFELHYLNWIEDMDKEIQNINIYDTFGLNRPDLFIGINDYYKSPAIYSDFYKNDFITKINDISSTIINKIQILQNYPNPFNSNTQIKFEINQFSKLNIIIYDITGKEVKWLVENELITPGIHTETWNGKNKNGEEVSSGVYMYQLKTDSFQQTKKMLLIR